MRSLVVDANVFHAFARETILGQVDNERTASPVPLFHSLGNKCIVFLDSGGQIQAEWAELTRYAHEWFQTWLAESFAEGRMYEIDASNDPQLVKRYRNAGFPAGKDIWYIKTAHGLISICNRNRPCLVAEDIDFYDPRKKTATKKADIFHASKGPVSRQLDADGIDIRCIAVVTGELGL